MSEQARVRATVFGRVQGVGFRYFVLHKAQEVRVKGWVRNLRGGQVELLAEGPRPVLEGLLAAVREGPPMAWVERVETEWAEPMGDLMGFDLRYTV